MRPPRFWFNPPSRPGWQTVLLAPFGWLAAGVTRRRMTRQSRGQSAGVPVICVGNINMGGTGKTPTVIALAMRLLSRGQNVQVVSRGYGGRLTGPVRVSEQEHRAGDVGDEPLLMSAFVPVWISRDRAAGMRAAQAAGATVILFDDGFQNPATQPDRSIVVVDAGAGFGNGRVAPAGPLRETVADGLARASMVLVIGPPAAREAFAALWPMPDRLPVIGAELQVLETGMDWAGLKVLAFAGIGRPEKFFATLRGLGADLVKTVPLDDHQPLTEALMTRITRDAAAAGAQLVTTEKDAIRLPEAMRGAVLALPVRLEPDDWSAIDAMFADLGL